MNSTLAEKNGDARPEMDVVLRKYFHAEMPHPWPRFNAPLGLRMSQPVSFWSRYAGRLALAACVTLLVAGYLTLSGYFPRTVAPNGTSDLHLNIGSKDKGSGKHIIQPKPNE